MPANLPPQFFALQTKLKQAVAPEEKISILEEMLAICPKHKGTEKVQKDLKTKIAKLKKQKLKRAKKEVLYSVPKEEAGQIAIIGPVNSGKSSLLNVLTNAGAKVAPYPFTTSMPKPAMMRYENILIQLIDTPPLSKESPGWLKAIICAADGIIAVFDLSNSEIEKEIKELREILKKWNLENKKILFLGNKIDLPKAKENFGGLKEKIKPISAQNKIGLEELKKELFDLLEIARVYSKKPGKKPDFGCPFVVKRNAKLIELAKEINEDFAPSFKYARLFRKNSSKAQIVGKDYTLKDEDIIEIHA